MREVGAGQSASRRQVAPGGLLLPRLFCLLLFWTKESAGLADFSGKGTRPLAAAVPLLLLSVPARQDGRAPVREDEEPLWYIDRRGRLSAFRDGSPIRMRSGKKALPVKFLPTLELLNGRHQPSLT